MCLFIITKKKRKRNSKEKKSRRKRKMLVSKHSIIGRVEPILVSLSDSYSYDEEILVM